jgi:integrase
MANIKVGLMRRVKTDQGWGHYPAAYAANGRVKPFVAIVGGREVKLETGYYELRYYEGSKLRFESLPGISPADAENARRKKEAQLSVVKAAKNADVQIVPTDPKRKRLADQLSVFIDDKLGRGAEEAAEVNKRAFDEFLAITGVEYADEITDETIRQYHREMAKRGRSKRTVHNRDANVKSFLRYCGFDTKGLTKAPKYDKTMPEIYTDDELTSLYRSISDPKQNMLYRLLVETGIREQEAMYLEWGDIDSQTKKLRVHSKPKWDFRVKDFEERELMLSEDMLARIKEYKTNHVVGSGLIFDRNGTPDGHMLRTLKHLVRDAGLNCGICAGCNSKGRECERWFLHKFRATFATKLLRPHLNKQTGLMEPGQDIVTVQKMMGHSDLTSTMRYLRPAEGASVQAAVNSIYWG